MRLSDLHDFDYAGYSYSQASRRAQDVCAIAATTGQTILAHQHLSVLTDIMRRTGASAGKDSGAADELMARVS